MPTILAVDPGRVKCGVAVVRRTEGSKGQPRIEVLHRAVVPTDELAAALAEQAAKHAPDVLIVGNGTTRAQALDAAHRLPDLRVELVDERSTTLAARKRFFEDNRPRWLRRLIPTSLQTPNRPYDDYVAIILAEQYLSRTSD